MVGVYVKSVCMPNYGTLLQKLCSESCSGQWHFLTLSKSKISYNFIAQFPSAGNGKLGVGGICKKCLHAKLYHSTANTVPRILCAPVALCKSKISYNFIAQFLSTGNGKLGVI